MSGGVLFVCLGNICRSPLAEAIARQEFARSGLDLSFASAGTGDWHIGEPADARARKVAAAHGYSLESHRARQVSVEDFRDFDWLLAMDRSNLAELRKLAPAAAHARCALMLELAGIDSIAEVPDPYFGAEPGFEEVLQLLRRAMAGLAPHLGIQGGAGARR